MSMDKDLRSALTGAFVIVNLGAGGDTDYNLPVSFLRTITLIEADAGRQPIGTTVQYHDKHTIHDIIAGGKSPRCFTRRKFWGCSSLYEPRQDLILQYGLENYFEAESVQEVVPVTLSEIMNSCGVDTIDYLKTDLEGADFEVIKSCEGFMDQILAIKCELRFQPFFQGEPFFHQVMDYLHLHDFEMIGLKPVYWKPVTEHGKNHRDGRVVFADCLFFKKIDSVMRFSKETLALAAVKQVLIAVLSGKKCYAEWLLDQYRDLLPGNWQEEVRSLVIPHPMQGNIGHVIKWCTLVSKKITHRIRKTIHNQKNAKGFDDSYTAPGE
jgi:hypothetical protein